MERPILFSTEMVQALLDGRKTQTRRTKGLKKISLLATEVVRSDNWAKQGDWIARFKFKGEERYEATDIIKCPFGKPGDLLWVRETWAPIMDIDDEEPLHGAFCYKADIDEAIVEWPWKPSIHMPKAAARIWLKVTNVRVERLKDISKTDALAEGVFEIEKDEAYKDYMKEAGSYAGPIGSFFSLWESIHGIDSLISDPWVWVIEFEVVSRTGRANAKEVEA